MCPTTEKVDSITRPDLAAIRAAARELIAQKVTPLPLPMIDGKLSKKPVMEGWQKMTVTADQIERLFCDGCNIGMRLDTLTDVDLDCWEAVKLAPYFLKQTAARFGHASKRNSHHLYLVEASHSVKFENDPSDKENKMLCEIRHGSGFQTMIPPSVHPSGEIVRWEGDPKATPATWDYPSLVRAVGRIAGGSLLARQLRDDSKTHNIRHAVWLCLGGAMARAEWPREEALRFCELVSGLICDKAADRCNVVEDSFQKKEAGEKSLAGLKKLEEYLDKSVVRKLAQWLDLRRAKSDDLDLTDDGNAQSLYVERGDDLHYVPTEGKGGLWLFWNGTIWQRDRLGYAVHSCAETLKKKAEVLTAGSRDGRHISRVRSELMNMAGITSAMSRLSLYPEVAASSNEFDSNPWLIGVQNGVYNLQSDCLEQGVREHLVSRQIAAAYNPEAKCPRWLTCLERAQPDADVRAFLQRLGGACLIGMQTEHGFIFNYGHGANFKTGYSEVFRRIMGPDYALTPNEQLFFKGNQEVPLNYVADLHGMRLLTTAEKEENSEWNISFIKKLLGGQELPACRKYCESFGFVPCARILAGANNKPRLNELDEALRRRFLLVPWLVTIPEDGEQLASTESDPDVILRCLKGGGRIPFEQLMTLLLEERDGIFAWMVAGARDFVARGLRLAPPPSIIAATQDYFEDEDVMGRFVKDWCDLVPIPDGLNELEAAKFVMDPTHGSLSSVLHRAFTAWHQAGKYSLGQFKVTRRLEKVKDVAAKRGTGNKLYLNLVLTEAALAATKAAFTAGDEEIPF